MGRDLSDASIWSCELLPQGENVSLLETQKEGTVFPSLKKYNNISNCNMLNASWHKCKNATSKMSAGMPGGFTWFKRFMRKNYFISFKASWKAAAPVWGTMEKEGKRNLQLKEKTMASVILCCSFQYEKKLGQAIIWFEAVWKAEQTEPAMGCACFLALHIDSRSPVAHLKPHNSSLLQAGLNPEIPDFSAQYCFTRSCSAAVMAGTRRLVRGISGQALMGETGSQTK